MSKLDDSFQNAQNTRRDLPITSIIPIKVLVVDHKKESLEYVVEFLHSFSFEVTGVDHFGAALKLLTEKNNQYDLLLIDDDLTGMDIHTFLILTKNMDLLSVVMSEQEEDDFTHKVLTSGAFIVIKRPLTNEVVWHMRQDVIRQRMHKHENRKNRGKYDQPKKRAHQSSEDDKDGEHKYEDDDDGDNSMKKKICMEWTEELHEKFLNACNQLGEGRCFPKQILELMGVPGLTRMQVASHLQVYHRRRKEKLKSNEKKFGCMPSLETDHEESSNTLIDMSNGWQTQLNQIENKSNEKHIAQQTDYTQIPFGRDHLQLNQDGRFGTRINTTTNCYFQQTIPNSLDFVQGSNDCDLSSIPREAYDGFPNFLKDLDGIVPNDI